MLPFREDLSRISEFVLTSKVLCEVLKDAEEMQQDSVEAKEKVTEDSQQKSPRRSERVRKMFKKPSYKV